MGDKTDMHDVVWPTLGPHAVGALPARLAARADRHLDACVRCRERLAGYTAAVDQLAIVGEGSSPELVDLWEWTRERVRRQGAPEANLGVATDS